MGKIRDLKNNSGTDGKSGGEKTTVTFWGGVGSVTGANFILKKGDIQIMVDCGLLQGVPGSGGKNHEDFPYDPASVDFLFLTHAHIDHIGRVPKLVKDGFRGTIYSTRETKEISVFMFEDALKLSKHVADDGPPRDPLYEKVHVDQALSQWKEIPYHEKREFTPGLFVELFDAGHILGSSMFKISTPSKSIEAKNVPSKNIVFTGDLGNSPAPIIKDTEFVTDANYLVVDSVYGDRNHESKEDRDKNFERIVREAIERKGTLVVPAFSLDRTQILLYELNNLIEEGKIPSVPVFLDSPLGIKLTAIYKNSSKFFNQTVQQEIREGDDIFNFPKLKTAFTFENSMMIDETRGPKIIIAGSGMSNGGRVTRHEMAYLPDPDSTILLTGYQSVGTMGRMLQEGAKEVEINGSKVAVRARVEMISGYSAHKDSDNIINFVEHTRKSLEQVFVVMGEPKSSLFLTQRLRDYLDVPAMYPERGREYEIDL